MFAYCGNNPVNMTDRNGSDPTPAWAIRINSGTATPADYQKALSVNPNSWAGFASIAVNKAISAAKENRNSAIGAEHHKKGTTNPTNRKKHEQGQARKQRDNHGEKGDARRTPNPNKRRIQYIEPEYSFGDKLLSGVAILGAGASVLFLAADDITGVGSADNVAIAPLLSVIWDNAAVVFS